MSQLSTNRSFHTRLTVTDAQDEALRAAGAVYGKVMHTVAAAMASGDKDPRTRLTAELGVQRWYIDSAMRRVKGLLDTSKQALKRAADDLDGVQRKSTFNGPLPDILVLTYSYRRYVFS